MVVSPDVGVYTAVVTAGIVPTKAVPEVRVSQRYEIAPTVAVAAASLVNAGGVSPAQIVADT